MTREEAIKKIKSLCHGCVEFPHCVNTDPDCFKALEMAIKDLSTEPCREADDYENEIADLHNRLDIAEYDKERLREEVTALEEKLKSLSVEPCEDAISRAGTIEWLKRVTVTDGITFETGFKQILTDIQNMPSVTPKQKMGRWIESDALLMATNEDGCMKFPAKECSVCHKPHIKAYWMDYCPNCGAKMVDVTDINFGNMSENPTGSNCTTCILDGTDACSRGAGRAVDGRVCEDFVGESED